MNEKKKGRGRKRKNTEGFEEDEEGRVKRRKEGKSNVRMGKDL